MPNPTPGDIALNLVVELKRTVEALQIELGAVKRRVEALEEEKKRGN